MKDVEGFFGGGYLKIRAAAAEISVNLNQITNTTRPFRVFVEQFTAACLRSYYFI